MLKIKAAISQFIKKKSIYEERQLQIRIVEMVYKNENELGLPIFFYLFLKHLANIVGVGGGLIPLLSSLGTEEQLSLTPPNHSLSYIQTSLVQT